jgi:alpha-beta hydrolase superfamily lysophospholipase
MKRQPTQTVAEMVRADERLTKEFPLISLPVLILHGTSDKATRRAAASCSTTRLISKDKTLKLYDGHFHDLLNDVDKEVVMADIKCWRVEAQRFPSRAEGDCAPESLKSAPDEREQIFVDLVLG